MEEEPRGAHRQSVAGDLHCRDGVLVWLSRSDRIVLGGKEMVVRFFFMNYRK